MRALASSAIAADGTGAATATATASVSADRVLDWAEFKFPDLFPKAVAQRFPAVVYEGVTYNARAYSGAWGTRYLGITPDGRVFGLGDFTNQSLQAFETVAHWSAQVTADACAVYPGSCALAPTISAQPQSFSAAVGQTVTFSVTAAGAAPLSYQWLRNGVDIGGATSASYTTPAVGLADSGARYTVRVSNAAGSVTSGQGILTVTAGTVGTLEGRAWATAQSLEENASLLEVRGVRRQVIDDAGRVTVLFLKNTGTRVALHATHGTPGAASAVPTWTVPVVIDSSGGTPPSPDISRFSAVASPGGVVVVGWVAQRSCTDSTYTPVPAQLCWYQFVARYTPAGGWEPPRLVTDVPPMPALPGAQTSAEMLDLQINDRGDIVLQGAGWTRTSGTSYTVVRSFYFLPADQSSLSRQPFDAALFGAVRWQLDGAGNLLLGAERTQNGVKDIVAYRGTLGSGFDFGTPMVLDTRNTDAILLRVLQGVNGQGVVLWTQFNGTEGRLFAATSPTPTSSFSVAETGLSANGLILSQTVTDDGQAILYDMSASTARRVVWTATAGWSAPLQLPTAFPSQPTLLGRLLLYGVARSGDLLVVNTNDGSSASYDVRRNVVVLGPPSSAGNASFVIGRNMGSSAQILGFATPVLSTSGVGFVDMVNLFDLLPSAATPAGRSQGVPNLWGAFLR